VSKLRVPAGSTRLLAFRVFRAFLRTASLLSWVILVTVVARPSLVLAQQPAPPAPPARPTPPPEPPKPAPSAPAPVKAGGQSPPALDAEASAAPADRGADPRLWTEHGHNEYTAVRTKVPPKIDGILDDQIWGIAPLDNRFRDTQSKPFGVVLKEPTAIQVAYDNDNLYVAFRLSYSDNEERDDFFPPDEASAHEGAETVGVQVDARHDHSNARAFIVTRTGAMADRDLTQNAAVSNQDWRGIWYVATQIQRNNWYAEFSIPWSTLGLPSHDGAFVVGINFRRNLPRRGIRGTWSLIPPAPNSPNPPSFAGHLVGLSDVHPHGMLYLQPFIVGKYRGFTTISPTVLRDFTGADNKTTGYAGIYARFRPIGPLQIDVSFNPDFSQVPPDQALANLDRFELALPETRPFFNEDRGKFEFGSENAQLFYSRRVGLAQSGAGSTNFTEVPIIYTGKAVVRDSGTEAAAMTIGLSDPVGKLRVADKIAIARVNHFFGKSTRIGGIALLRDTDTVGYSATGIDGATSFMNENLVLSGFVAESATSDPAGGGNSRAGTVGQADLHWDSADFEARLTYLDVSSGFDPQLGYFQATGVKNVTVQGGYTPIVVNDFVREIDLRAQVAHTETQGSDLLYNRANFSLNGFLLNGSVLTASFLPSVEGVLTPFTLAGQRIRVPTGRYSNERVQAIFSSPPGRMVVASAGYTEGQLFYGYQRTPQAQLGLNIGRYAGSTLYKLFLLNMAADHLVGHQVSSRMAYSYTPLARSTLAVEMNTLDPRATVQLVNTFTFGELSTIALIFQRSAPAVDFWLSHTALTSAILSFGYGISVL
jgi:Domain of unknown function (DUF5916)